MKTVPRRAENRVAALLTEFFVSIGQDPVERIPVTGRKGPDISLNDIKLIIDVKSRQEVPDCYVHEWPTYHGDYLAFPIHMLKDVVSGILVDRPALIGGRISKIVTDYYNHMDEWTQEKKPSGITCLVLRQIKMPYGKSMVVIHKNNLSELEKRCKKISS